MMFQNDTQSPLPSHIHAIVTSFIMECERLVAGMSAADQNSAGDQQYVKFEKQNSDGKFEKIGPLCRGQISAGSIAGGLFKVPSCNIRVAFYPFGGSSQAKGSRILRSVVFDWINDDTEEDEPSDPSVSARGLASAEDAMRATLVLLARVEERRAESDKNWMSALQTQMSAYYTAVDRLTDKALKGAEMTYTLAIKAAETADGREKTAYGMKTEAMRMETNAIVAERRAQISMQEAQNMMENAEDALEEGKTEGWMRFMSVLLSNEAGSKMVTDLLGKVITVIETKLIGSDNETLAKLGAHNLGEIITKASLTQEQVSIIGNILSGVKK